LNQYPFRVADQTTERRVEDRRHDLDAESVHSGWMPHRRAVFLGILLISLGFLVREWRYVVYGPVWLVRAHWADRSDLYMGKTNGISNLILTQQARNYLTDIDRIDAPGNITAPEFLRPVGGHLDMKWFSHHAPDAVDFNPFISPGGLFVVTWLYYPGCEKTLKISSRTDTDWYGRRGRPCFPLCRLTVLMDSNLKLTTMKVTAFQS
jgi:hypothetical protein